MKRLFTYISEKGGLPDLGYIDAPTHEFVSLCDVFEKILQHECLITQWTNALPHVAFSSQNYSTFNFLQCYVAEHMMKKNCLKGY